MPGSVAPPALPPPPTFAFPSPPPPSLSPPPLSSSNTTTMAPHQHITTPSKTFTANMTTMTTTTTTTRRHMDHSHSPSSVVTAGSGSVAGSGYIATGAARRDERDDANTTPLLVVGGTAAASTKVTPRMPAALPLPFALSLFEDARLRTAAVAAVLNFTTYTLWTLINKWQFMAVSVGSSGASSSSAAGGLGMAPYALSTTVVQMGLAGLCAAGACAVVHRRSNTKHASSSSCTTTLAYLRGLVSWRVLRHRILPLGLSRAVDIGLGNLALTLVTVAVQQIFKSLLPLFVTVLSVLFLQKRYSARLYASLVPIVMGTILVTWTRKTTTTIAINNQHISGRSGGRDSSPPPPPSVSLFGVCVALVSCVGRAMKAILNGISLNPTATFARLTPLEVLLLEAPTTSLLLLLPAFLIEIVPAMLTTTTPLSSPLSTSTLPTSVGGNSGGGQQASSSLPSLPSHSPSVSTIVLVNILQGALMFVNQASYITVIDCTSPLTCQVIMNLKMLFVIAVSLAVFPAAAPFSLWNWAGVAAAFGGCAAYAAASASEARRMKPTENMV